MLNYVFKLIQWVWWRIQGLRLPPLAATLITFSAVLAAALTSGTGAATIFVDDSATAGSNNGTSWTHAYLKLQTAIAAASSGDVIWVAAGIYFPDEGTGQTPDDRDSAFPMKNSVEVYGGFDATEENNDFGFKKRKPFVNYTYLDGDIDNNNNDQGNDNAYHVVKSTNVQDLTILDGFVIRNGVANVDGNNRDKGGGLLLTGGSASDTVNLSRILRCVFIKNKAKYGGGAALLTLNYDFQNEPQFQNCKFIDNLADSGNGNDRGGAVYNIPATSSYITDQTEFHNCLFDMNTVQGDDDNDGGAVWSAETAFADFFNCTVVENTSGLIHENQGPASIGVHVIQNGILYDNDGDDFDGAATITYSDVEDSLPTGSGNISDPPLFVDPDGADDDDGTIDDEFELQKSGTVSPCIDTGDFASLLYDTYDLDQDGETEVFGSAEYIPDLKLRQRVRKITTLGCIIDMGAYEAVNFCAGDITSDGSHPGQDGLVDIDDLFMVIAAWGNCPGSCPPACQGDVTADGSTSGSDCTVDIDDLFFILTYWGECEDCSLEAGQIPHSYEDCEELCERLSGQQWADCMCNCLVLAGLGEEEDCE